VVSIFFRRSLHNFASPSTDDRSSTATSQFLIKAMLHPANRSAIALRNYGLAIAIGLVPVVVFIIKSSLPSLLASFLFNFGAVMAIGAVMLVYLNHAPEPTTISAKLVGISMVTFLLLLGMAGVWLTLDTPVGQTHNTVVKFIWLVLLSSALIIILFPFFFRTTLLDPLARLLNGVKSANEGNLDVQVSVQYDDEVGYLTDSFNRMVHSLRDIAYELQDSALNLEKDVAQRTLELVKTNVELEQENVERSKAEALLNQQLLYQKALADCSQSLLALAEDEASQRKVLHQALEHLRSGAQVSRAYIFQLFEDSYLGLCMGMIAELCAPGIPAQINNPTNLKFPLSRLPSEFMEVLAKGNPYGGLVKQVFASTPALQEAFLTQIPPLLSVMFFPLFMRDQVWGFIGFDDCMTEREWGIPEVSMLRTASEIVGNTIYRWEIETRWRDTLDELEIRVEERTAALSQSNLKLNEEIQLRQQAQHDLETRLLIEEQLAAISIRLQEPSEIRDNISASLADLAQIMDAGRIFLAEFDLQAANRVMEYIEWHAPGIPPISVDIVQGFMDAWSMLQDRLREGETIFIEDTSQLPSNVDVDMSPLQVGYSRSLVLSPIMINQRMHGMLGCTSLQVSPEKVQVNLRALELVADMLKSLLQREYLIQTLEEQIVERTRQLTTFLDMAMLGDQAQDLADILQPTLLSITQIASCDACSIHIINEERSNLQLVAQRGIPVEFMQPLSEVEIDAEFAAWFDEADPYELLGDPEQGPVFPEPFCFPGFRSFFANHLITGSKSLGLLSCYRFEDQPFSPFQATLLTALGELLGIIVENHRLRSEAEDLAAVEERQYLAREIHDAVSQSVYSLSLFARSANDALDEQNQEKLLANLQDIEETALGAMREMRLLLYQLREVGQEDDIAAALNTRFKQVENRLGIKATSDIETGLLLPPRFRHQVWRILVEALNNVVKHAGANRVHVKITCLNEYLAASIQDDGTGFDIQNYFAGMGLKNMQSRAEMMAGDLDIVSAPGQGTQISLKIPLAFIDP
jgi:signal transduction histidine kinase/HAMP domain-containing protein